MKMKWYLVFVRANWEKKVIQILSRKKIENYCPLTKSAKNKKTIEQPLIPSHIFIKVPQEQHAELRKIPGIINFVYWLGEPVVIKDAEINMIKRFSNEYSDVALEKTSVNVNESARIINYSITEHQGQLVSVKIEKIKAILPSIGYAIISECTPSNVTVISSSKKSMITTNFIRRIKLASKQLAGYS